MGIIMRKVNMHKINHSPSSRIHIISNFNWNKEKWISIKNNMSVIKNSKDDDPIRFMRKEIMNKISIISTIIKNR